MAVDTTVSLGDIITASAFLITGLGAVFAIRTSVTVLSTKVDETDKRNDERFMRIDAQLEDSKAEMKKLSDVLQALTRTEGRMNLTDERVLAQGKRLDSIADALKDILSGRIPLTKGI